MGSLTGAVASQKVTEALNGSLSTYRNRAWSVKVEESLTARSTDRAGTKVGLSDPAMHCVLLVAQRIKVTPGITGSSPPRVHIDEEVWYLDVGLPYPGAEAGSKGWAVRPLKRDVSWVQDVVRQSGPYLLWAEEICEEVFLVREERKASTAGVSVVLPRALLSSYVLNR